MLSESPTQVHFTLAPHLEMRVPSFSALNKRKIHAQDENTTASRIQVKSPTTSALTMIPLNTSRSRPRSPSEKASPKSAEGKFSIPFPKSRTPAVVTPLPVNGRGCITAAQVELPRLGKTLRPSTAAKAARLKDAKSKAASATPPSLWKSLLSSGKGVIAQTFDRDLLRGQATPYCATMVTPDMLEAGFGLSDLAYHAQVAVKLAMEHRLNGNWDLEKITARAMEYYLVALGVELMEDVAGPHFTFVDPRNHGDTKSMVRQALRLLRLFARKGYRRDRIVISIPATEAGVQAAMMLEQSYFVRTNLLFVSGPAHAAICAQAGASFVTFSYTAVYHGIEQRNANNSFARIVEALIPSTRRLADEAIERTAEYFKHARIETVVLLMGLKDVTDAQRLKGFDSIVLDATQSLQAKVPMPDVPPACANVPIEGSLEKGPMCEAQIAPSYLSSAGGTFLATMPTETRNVARTTLDKSLTEQKRQMRATSGHMFQFVQDEAQTAHYDLATIEAFYEDDVHEHLNAHSGFPVTFIAPPRPSRYDDVGFRMICSLWDKPEAL